MQSNIYTKLDVNKYSQFQHAWVLPKVFKNAMVYFKKFCGYE